MVCFLLPVSASAEPRTGTTSYYTVASTTREGTGGPRHLMANGHPLHDEALVAASWFYPFGTKLKVSRGPRSVIVTVTDRGPSKRLVQRGRIIDLSSAAFAKLGALREGVLPVTVEPVR